MGDKRRVPRWLAPRRVGQSNCNCWC